MAVVVHNGNAVADGKSNFLVMRYIHNRYAELTLQSLNLEAHFLTQVSVKVGKRLIQKHNRRVCNQCACQSNTLLLAAGKLGWQAFVEPFHTDNINHFHY